jgi:hypothetical protein
LNFGWIFWVCFTLNTFFHQEFEGEHGEGETGQQLTAKKPSKQPVVNLADEGDEYYEKSEENQEGDHDEDNGEEDDDDDEDDEGEEDTENSRDKSVENGASKKRTSSGAPKVPVSQIFLTFIVGLSSGVQRNKSVTKNRSIML